MISAAAVSTAEFMNQFAVCQTKQVHSVLFLVRPLIRINPFNHLTSPFDLITWALIFAGKKKEPLKNENSYRI